MEKSIKMQDWELRLLANPESPKDLNPTMSAGTVVNWGIGKFFYNSGKITVHNTEIEEAAGNLMF